jgi:hypothetical protein
LFGSANGKKCQQTHATEASLLKLIREGFETLEMKSDRINRNDFFSIELRLMRKVSNVWRSDVVILMKRYGAALRCGRYSIITLKRSLFE